ncbi:MAG: MerR family transcriptional regulator [Bacteroidota bacterium]|nr:MerR family transcriptional regulator [Bacteroidota bacterium]
MQDAKYVIKVASRLSGLSPYVIRAWEKRYGVVHPERTDSNRRMYSNEEVEHLRLLRKLTEAGYPIGSIAGMTTDALRLLLEGEEGRGREAAGAADTESAPQRLRAQLLEHAKKLDGTGMERLLVEGSVLFSHRVLLEEVVIPFVEDVGRGWKDGSLRIAHEHVATAAVRNLLTNLLYDAQPTADAPSLIVSTPQGQAHELGALIGANIAVMSGWDVTWLGPDLPAEEIAASAREIAAVAVLLSIVYPPDDPRIHVELANLADMLLPGVSIVVGGRSAPGYRDTIDRIDGCLLESMDHLWDWLDRRRSADDGCLS